MLTNHLVTKQCIALAFPPRDASTGEVIPPRTGPLARQPANQVHGDMHVGNFMFGDRGYPQQISNNTYYEHVPLPILKLIDFGSVARITDDSASTGTRNEIVAFDQALGFAPLTARNLDQNAAMNYNILAIGEIMAKLIIDPAWDARSLEDRYRMVRLHRDKRGENRRDPNLDAALLSTVVRCLAASPANRPRLTQLLVRVSEGARKAASAYPRVAAETDAAISMFVQRNIFDPPRAPLTPPRTPPRAPPRAPPRVQPAGRR
ncbi:hypothetical protein GGR57DRAFT_304027 [Xylariaceae sp. FL1272]|nr:hypothetical protein GGR57DRAFT_304027 [Xylariaceae sp. FL1272]